MMGSRIGLPITEKCWKQAGGRFESRAGQVPDRLASGGWLVFAGGPAAALAASHLRSPATFTVQLDHLLSSVAVVNHSDREKRTHFSPKLTGLDESAGRTSVTRHPRIPWLRVHNRTGAGDCAAVA